MKKFMLIECGITMLAAILMVAMVVIMDKNTNYFAFYALPVVAAAIQTLIVRWAEMVHNKWFEKMVFFAVFVFVNFVAAGAVAKIVIGVARLLS